MRRLRIAVLGLALVLVACGNEGKLTDLAIDTCQELDGSIVLTAGLILQDAIAEAEDLGFTAPELGDKMREECPGIMAAIENVGEEQERREDLPNQVSLELDGCTSDGASGTVTNNADVTVSVFIEVQFTNDAGVLVDIGLGSVDGLRPGQTGEWEAFFFGDDYARCRANIDSVYED